MEIKVIPVLQDNYSYLVFNSFSKKGILIDPAEPSKIYPHLAQVQLLAVLATHHHHDHSGGNKEISERYNVPVYGADERVESITNLIQKDREGFSIDDLQIDPILTPCHTTGSVSYLISCDKDPHPTPSLFTGDTLFIGGCGRFFEGNAEQMYRSLKKLSALPDDTKVYVGHEYTLKNFKFALEVVDPENIDLKNKYDKLSNVKETVPSTILDEKRTNPFMRTDQAYLLKRFNMSSPVDLLLHLRELKNKF